MDPHSEQDNIDDILDSMIHIIKSKPYNKNQLVGFKDLINKVHGIQNKDLLRTSYNKRGIDLVYLICKHNKKKLFMYLLLDSHILHYFTSENKDIETKYREDTLYHTICSHQFHVIEILYDHWTGDLHWLGHKKEYSNFDVENLKQINKILKTALERYENWTLGTAEKRIDQSMMFHIKSLIALSEFQTDLYSKLNKLKEDLGALEGEPVDKIRLKETCAIRNMILDMFKCYEEQTKNLGNIIQNSVFEEKSNINEYDQFLETPKDTSKILPKTYLYAFFEVYFRKLDYNICLLILDNLHSLKLRLIMPSDSYQKLENKLYHFIHHISNKWNFYIPKKRNLKTKTVSGTHNNIPCTFVLKYNADIFEKGLHIMYLERKDFESALSVFKNELFERNVEMNIRKNKIDLPNEEVNCLILEPELRDIYSLTRISQHIEQLYSRGVKYTKGYVCLLIERALQVVGEFLKSTNDTLHLQPTTKALVEVETSVEIVNDLKNLRDLLCHAKHGEILKRIEIETYNNYIFDLILIELRLMKKKIDKVIMIYKPLVEKALVIKSLSLIDNRKKEMPDFVANKLFMALRRVRSIPQNEPYWELIWAPKGYAGEFGTEIILLVEHGLQLESKLKSLNENIRQSFIRKYPIYKEKIIGSLRKIIEVKVYWQQIVTTLKNEDPSITLLDYPNENDENRIKTHAVNNVLADASLNCPVENNTLFAYTELHWNFIKKLLEFILLKTEIIYYTCDELNKITQEFKELSYKNRDIEKIVLDYLVMIEEEIKNVPEMKHENPCSEFIAIKDLRRKLTMTNFLIQEEKNYLTTTLEEVIKQDELKQNEKKKIDKINEMIGKIKDNVAIPKTELTNFVASINLNQETEKTLMNLVMGYKRDPLHLSCLSKRIAQLREIMTKQSVDQLVTRYKLDKTFRVLLEVLVFDIFAILECTKNNDIVKKTSKLLTEMNLRNFLIHGSPLLEIVGNVLDSNDLPRELITKALEILKEEQSINALCALKVLDFDFTQINSDSLSLNYRTLVTEFKTSVRWKDYLIFIPKLKYIKRKKKNEIDEKLLEAVKKKNLELVQEIILEGGNVNHIDDSRRALVHHATIKGSVEVLKVLVNNGADVNIRSKHNMTALHFAAMNGFTAVVDLLLKNKADYLVEDDMNRSPMDLARERNHEKVCLMLEQVMKK